LLFYPNFSSFNVIIISTKGECDLPKLHSLFLAIPKDLPHVPFWFFYFIRLKNIFICLRATHRQRSYRNTTRINRSYSI